jgi:hypothetical protein
VNRDRYTLKQIFALLELIGTAGDLDWTEQGALLRLHLQADALRVAVLGFIDGYEQTRKQ